MKKESLKIEEDESDRYNNVNHNNDNSDEDCLKITKNPKFSFLKSSISLWLERWFWSSNAKDIGVLYLIFALFSGLLGTGFSVLIRLELSGPGVQYISDNQLYNSIITAHAILMIFFMVGKNFNIFNFKSQPSLNLEKVNSDNNNILIIGLNHNNNQIIIAYYLVNFKRVILFSSYVQVSFISIGLKLKKPNYLSILTRNYSSMNVVLHPAWVTGFTDAEGSFILTITKKTKLNVGWLSDWFLQLDFMKKTYLFYRVWKIYLLLVQL